MTTSQKIQIKINAPAEIVARYLEDGCRLWGGGIGVHRFIAGQYVIQYVGDEGEGCETSHADVWDAAWEFIRRANGATVTVEPPAE